MSMEYKGKNVTGSALILKSVNVSCMGEYNLVAENHEKVEKLIFTLNIPGILSLSTSLPYTDCNIFLKI